MRHNIDRALFEAEDEDEYGGSGEYELMEQTSESSQERELANQLLEVASEEELDQFIGDLIVKATSAARNFASSDAGRAVGGVLKSAAKKALPQIGRIAGDAIRPGSGGAMGQAAGQWLGDRFELAPQTEGMSAEDREFDTARSFVRFAQEAAQRTAATADRMPPATAAKRAATTAAQNHLPGLLHPTPSGPGSSGSSGRSPATEGRWVRRGQRIVLFGA